MTVRPADEHQRLLSDLARVLARRRAGLVFPRSPHGDARAGEAGRQVVAGQLHPVTGALLSAMVTAAAMALSSISVVLNAAQLNRSQLPRPSRLRQASSARHGTPAETSARPSLR